MATSSESVECPICNEDFKDPRALPCGHSYCGPPRTCLKTLESSGALRCAVCRVGHNLKVEDVKPLYGIREFFEDKSLKYSPELRCSIHPKHECSMWCIKCDHMVCEDCLETEHDGHAMRKLRKYLVERAESIFGENLNEGVSRYRETLQTEMESSKTELERLKLQVRDVENKLNQEQAQLGLLEDFFSDPNQDESASKRGLSSLLKLAQLPLAHKNPKNDDERADVQSSTSISADSVSANTEIKTVSSSCVSTQTEVERVNAASQGNHYNLTSRERPKSVPYLRLKNS